MDLAGVARSQMRPLQAIVAAVDPHLDVEVGGTDADWTARVIETDTAAKEFREVAVYKFSGGVGVGVRATEVSSADGGLIVDRRVWLRRPIARR